MSLITSRDSTVNATVLVLPDKPSETNLLVEIEEEPNGFGTTQPKNVKILFTHCNKFIEVLRKEREWLRSL